MQNKGISIITLVITIIVIIILASIITYNTYNAINATNEKDVKEEFAHVEAAIGTAKAKGLVGEFKPNSNYLITPDELSQKFSNVLTAEQIELINETNDDASIDPLKKYYLLNQDGFDAEFAAIDSVTATRLKREYLVSYNDRIIIVNVNGNIISSGEIEKETPTYSELKVVFEPNGNTTWAKSHSVKVNVTGTGITRMTYLWSQSSEEPASTLISNVFSSGATLTLDNKTGNDWYIWVLVEYSENGQTKRYLERSNAFFIDNEPPTGVLERIK